MTPQTIENISDISMELISVSSALHTNAATNGGLIEGAEHAMEHLHNVLHNLNKATAGLYTWDEVQHYVTRAKNIQKEQLNTETIATKLGNDIDHIFRNFNNKFGVIEGQKELMDDLKRFVEARCK